MVGGRGKTGQHKGIHLCDGIQVNILGWDEVGCISYGLVVSLIVLHRWD